MSFTATDPSSHKGITDSWLTPLWIIEALGGDFDLDPCGFKYHRTAKRIIQLPECGLSAKWNEKVWLNPPDSDDKKALIQKLKERCELGQTISALIVEIEQWEKK